MRADRNGVDCLVHTGDLQTGEKVTTWVNTRGLLPVKPVNATLISLSFTSLFDTTQELKNLFLSATLTFNMRNSTLIKWELINNLITQKDVLLALTDLLMWYECWYCTKNDFNALHQRAPMLNIWHCVMMLRLWVSFFRIKWQIIRSQAASAQFALQPKVN